MPRPTGSASQRCGGKNNREQLIEDTLHTIETEGISLATAEKRYTIPKQTLGHRKNGRKPRRLAHATQQALSPEEEEELVDWLREMDSWGLHLRLNLVKACAEAIRRECGSNETLGIHWIQHFMDGHPEIHSALSQWQDVQRARAEWDPERMELFYDNVCQVIVFL
jgi:hypothetical protein